MDNKNTILLLALALLSINYAALNGMEYDEAELLTKEKAKSKIGNWFRSVLKSATDQFEERNPRKEKLNAVTRAIAELEKEKAAKSYLDLTSLNNKIATLKQQKQKIQKKIEAEEKASDNTELLNKWFGYGEPTENPSALVEKWKGF